MIDHILLDAKIYTQNKKQAWADALAIVGERIVAVGNNDEIAALATARTKIDRCGGRLIIPGLKDAHLHFHRLAEMLQAVNLMTASSKLEAVARVEKRLKTMSAGQWLLGVGWRKDLWGTSSFPSTADLDAVSPDNPIYLIERSGHAAWVNSSALRLAGVDANSVDPAGGHIMRLGDGSPSGILLETPAMQLVQRVMPQLSVEQIADDMLAAQEYILKLGLTGFHDFDNPSSLAAFQVLRERGKLDVRVVKQINDPFIEAAYTSGLRTGFGDDWIRIGGLKVYADGALGPQTALMIEPYENNPRNYGITVMDKEEIYALVSEASRRGFASTIHAIGDQAVHGVLDVYEEVRREEAERGVTPNVLRHRIEHVQVLHPNDVERLAALKVIASMQPIHATSDYELVDRYWGKRGAYAYGFRQQLEAGAVLAFGSDAPLDDIDPIAGIHAAITRRRADGSPSPEGWYPAERLSLEETLWAYTQGTAYAQYAEDRMGILAPNYLADLVMLDQDWFELADAHELLNTKAIGTMVGGVWRYRDFD